MAYSISLYITPTTVTDLTAISYNSGNIVDQRDLEDFEIVNNVLEGSIRILNIGDTITISATGYQTQSIVISTSDDINITLLPVEFSNIEANNIKYYCKDEIARENISDISTQLANKANTDLSNVTTITNTLNSTATDPLINKINDINITTAPSNDVGSGIAFADTNDKRIGTFFVLKSTDGTQRSEINAHNEISGTNICAWFNIAVNSTGKDLCNASSGVKSSIADWGMPSATIDVTYNSTNHSAMNGTNFTNTTGYPCYLYVSTGTNHTANCTIYVKNISAGINYCSMVNQSIQNQGFVPIAPNQICQFYVFVPNGQVSWTATLHRVRGGL